MAYPWNVMFKPQPVNYYGVYDFRVVYSIGIPVKEETGQNL